MKPTHPIANLTLSQEEPTIVSREALHRWVIWQFPRRFGEGLCAALRPPLPSYGWIPAVVQKDEIHVQAHLAEPFMSPEDAVAFLQQKAPMAQQG